MPIPFESIYAHGLIRTAVCIPIVHPADVDANLRATVELAGEASSRGVVLALFPELGLSGYAIDDLHQQDALLDAVLRAIDDLRRESESLTAILIVGAPIRVGHALYNCAVIVYRGRVVGVVPKCYLPNYREFYEKRQFTAGRHALEQHIVIADARVPFGAQLVFDVTTIPDMAFGVEICEDLWVPTPPSTMLAMAGATVLCNLSASNSTIGKADYRRNLAASQSGRCIAAYMYAASGYGESTTDLAWDGDGLVYENNELLAQSERFASESQIVVADIDLERLRNDRMRTTSFGDAVAENRQQLVAIRHVPVEVQIPPSCTQLMRRLERFPYVPTDRLRRDERCYEAWNIQVSSLARRLDATGIQRVIVGVSGGLDSTQALIVAARTMDRLRLPRTNVLAWTMPGFATTRRTYENAWGLMRALGVTAGEVDIKPACIQMFKDIGHPFAHGEPVYDVTFENVQAGERTSHLFRLANEHHAIVVGTGDLSELALGWTTYGVGDHMSHYNVNVSVPKTLVQHLIRWSVVSGEFDEATGRILDSILATEISPELVPGNDEGEEPGQRTEAAIGPYELQDFNLYYVSRYGFRPGKVAFLAWMAWRDAMAGTWPDGVPIGERRSYELPEIVRWLGVFLHRFFQTSQFKRSCIPNGPKVGSGGSLSPRGDWRAPSDASARLWLAELDQLNDAIAYMHVPSRELSGGTR